jgi:hypothetical protein
MNDMFRAAVERLIYYLTDENAAAWAPRAAGAAALAAQREKFLDVVGREEQKP